MPLKIPAPQNWRKRLKFLIAHPEWPNQRRLLEELAHHRASAELRRPNGYNNLMAAAREKQQSEMVIEDLT